MANRQSSSDAITVKVVSYGRAFLSMYYVDPITRKRVVKSTGTANRREAERTAGQWERDVQGGAWQHTLNLSWQAFQDLYEAQAYQDLKPRTRETRGIVFQLVEDCLNPARLASMTQQTVDQFRAKLRAAQMGESSINVYLAHLRSMLNWAHEKHYLSEPIKLKLGKSKRRSRAVTGEEFDRMIDAAQKVRPHDHATWTRYLNGLWLSGLRLTESLILSWDRNQDWYVDTAGRHVALRIYGESQKSGKDQHLPIAPEFADMLLTTPEDQRHGLVFPLMPDGKQMSTKGVCKIISAIGKRAKVNVSDTRKVKWASAHDLRRAFGTRWAKRVTTAILQKMMRHESIATTMEFYASLDADDVGDAISQFRQHIVNTTPSDGGGCTVDDNSGNRYGTTS
jgi:integrase